VAGLADDEVCIGDRYRIGEAEFEVTQPQVTCYRVGLRLGEPELPALHLLPGPAGTPAEGEILICCARPRTDLVLDMQSPRTRHEPAQWLSLPTASSG